jgi:hypothetical protein
MSAIGQILGLVETKVKEMLGDLLGHNKEQDAKLADLEKRVAALEGKKPAAAPAAKTVRAGTASAKGQAHS